MKSLKHVLSIALVALMLLSCAATAFADTNGLTADGSITVKGLEAGDTVKYYKVIEWKDGEGWALTTAFSSFSANLETIVGKPADNTTTPATPAVPGAINSTLAGSLATNPGNATGTGSANASGEWTQNVDPGLYMVLITPAKSGFVYNPVFVAADFSQESTSPNEVTVNLSDSYSDTAMAKKSKVTVEKTAESGDGDAATADIGEEITFTIKTTIPEYADNYTSAAFKVSDTLSAGLELKADTISVKVGGAELAAANYDKSETGTSGFSVDFTSAYILSLSAATEVTITYKATVTNAAPNNVNADTNTVKVEYSNDPTNASSRGVTKDMTEHYTFSIDANLLGATNYETSELVKIGVDKNGNELTEKKTLSNGTVTSALQGAEFSLYTDSACTTLYKNTNFTGTITSDANGKLTIKGLDAGTYYLKETKAPTGFIKDDATHSITIAAAISEKTITETVDGIEVTYKVNTLDSYTVSIDGTPTSTYTATYDAATGTTLTSVSQGDATTKIKNVKGSELPSTGAAGTYALTVVGVAIFAVAAVMVIRDKKEKDRT